MRRDAQDLQLSRLPFRVSVNPLSTKFDNIDHLKESLDIAFGGEGEEVSSRPFPGSSSALVLVMEQDFQSAVSTRLS